MPHSFGYRARTRHMFAQDFRKHGEPSLSTYLHVYKVGDLVDIKANGAIHKGMPHKFYHGKTGTVYNVTKRGLGVIVNKRVRYRILPKRINVRIEHVKKSKSRDAFLQRVKTNDRLRKEAKEKGIQIPLKRQPQGTRDGHSVSTKRNAPITISPVPFEILL